MCVCISLSLYIYIYIYIYTCIYAYTYHPHTRVRGIRFRIDGDYDKYTTALATVSAYVARSSKCALCVRVWSEVRSPDVFGVPKHCTSCSEYLGCLYSM